MTNVELSLVERVCVAEIETRTGDFYDRRGEPSWRIEIDGFCADFDSQPAAENFAAAINRRIDQALSTLSPARMRDEDNGR